MITIRKSEDRFHTRLEWLDSRHTFSFGEHHDPAHMGFRHLRVINEDEVAPGRGFDAHPHRDMEIVSYVVTGVLEHRDNLGNGSVIRPGEVQRMTAGTGVTHSEYNPSATEPTRLLQIWIQPEARGLEPGYEQRDFPPAERRDVLRLVASRDGRDGSVTIHQDVDLYATLLAPGMSVRHALRPDRHAWVQVVGGSATVRGERLDAGDGAQLSALETITLTAHDPAEVLLFDLA